MFEQLDTDNGEDRFHGFVEHNETINGYGDITPYLGQVLSHGFIRVGGEDGSSGKNWVPNLIGQSELLKCFSRKFILRVISQQLILLMLIPILTD
jgi:hypothetical protein